MKKTFENLTTSPSKAQQNFADSIANALNIDFPVSSSQFNKYCYWDFINTYINYYRNKMQKDRGNGFDDYYDYDLCSSYYMLF